MVSAWTGWELARGSAVALTQIRQAHAHYGDVLSVTTQPDNLGLGVREAKKAVTKALRLFVVRVMASVRPQDPASADLASSLLAPIETWEHTAPAKRTAAPTTPPPAPAADPPGKSS